MVSMDYNNVARRSSEKIGLKEELANKRMGDGEDLGD